MKKWLIAFLLGNVLVIWFVRKFSKWIYNVNPEMFQYLWNEIVIPSMKNTIVDMTEAGVKRTIYGESGRPPFNGHRIKYNDTQRYRPHSSRINYNNPSTPNKSDVVVKEEGLIISNREEANRVVEFASLVLDNYGCVTRADLWEMVGLPTVDEDRKWGWVSLSDFNIRQVREGWILEFPKAEQIPQDA